MRGMAAVAAVPWVLPRALQAEVGPRVVRLGHIGTGNQGTNNLRNFLAVPGARSVAVCDPYRERRENAARLVREAQGHDPKQYNDYRDLLADPEVEAVVICTPDHWHVAVALEAVRAGKDLYLEKPLGYSLEQNRLLYEAVKRSDRVFQYGTQQRSTELIKRGIELVLNGYIGKLQHIEVWAPGGVAGGGSLDEIPVPEGLDYDLYLGPAPMRPCTSDRITSAASWFCADYAIGFIAGWGAHPLDLAIWGCDSDMHGPVTFRGAGAFPPANHLFNTCRSWDVAIGFGDGVTMRFMSSDVATPLISKYRRLAPRDGNGELVPPGDGTTFYGTKGWVSLSRWSCDASNPEWLRLRQCEGGWRVVYRNNYYRAFVESVVSRRDLVAPIDAALRSDALSHLSLLAIESGGEVVWDPKAYRIVTPEALNERMKKPVRGPWLRA